MDQIKKEVSKEELAEYPISKYSGKTIVIESTDLIEEAIEHINKFKVIGIDTETKPSFKKGVIHHVALIQIATDDCAYLFRINKTGLPEGIIKILTNRDILKVGIAFRDDIRDLNKMRPFVSQSILDLNEAAKKLGFESIGAKKLSALVLGFRISKRQQTSNWENSVLSIPQVEYAATDAWICLVIYKELKTLYPSTTVLP